MINPAIANRIKAKVSTKAKPNAA